ncbi:MAG: DUF6941 family protein [Chloroflexota bacterium]
MPMVDYLILADAVAAAEGKHYIHGAGWDTIWARSFPVMHASLGVAARIRLSAEEAGDDLRLTFDIASDDGQSILPEPIEASIHTDVQHPGFGVAPVIPFALNLANVRFPAAGTYHAVLRKGELPLADATFNLRMLPEIRESAQA